MTTAVALLAALWAASADLTREGDLDRFPSQLHVSWEMNRGAHYERTVALRAPIDYWRRPEYVAELARVGVTRERVWRRLENARHARYVDNEEMCCCELRLLREAIGRDAYDAGYVPPMAPYWFEVRR